MKESQEEQDTKIQEQVNNTTAGVCSKIQSLQEKLYKTMSKKVTTHITETLKMVFAAYQTSTNESTPTEPQGKLVISQPLGPANEYDKDQQEKNSLGRIYP